jgi:hypothetical protein
VVLVASFSAMLGVSAAGVAAPPPGVVDQRFLTDLRGRGHAVAQGTDEELIISAARKLCVLVDGRTYEQRRSILTSQEVDAVRRSFGDDPQVFVRIAVSGYCS